jgi:hypothetical protein
MGDRKRHSYQRRQVIPFFLLMLMIFSLAPPWGTNALQALVTDDTGTQGKGKYQFEINAELVYDKKTEWDAGAAQFNQIKSEGWTWAAAFTGGIRENLEVSLEAPYLKTKTRVNELIDPADPTADARGFGDVTIGAKWRFWENGPLSLGLKPEITLPTGDEAKGLGNGRPTYSLTFLAAGTGKQGSVYLNLGYSYQDHKSELVRAASRQDIWHASLAGEVFVTSSLKLVANLGIDTNSDKTSHTHPAFAAGGMVYSLGESFEFTLGVKAGLNAPADDLAWLSGIALKF